MVPQIYGLMRKIRQSQMIFYIILRSYLGHYLYSRFKKTDFTFEIVDPSSLNVITELYENVG